MVPHCSVVLPLRLRQRCAAAPRGRMGGRAAAVVPGPAVPRSARGTRGGRGGERCLARRWLCPWSSCTRKPQQALCWAPCTAAWEGVEAAARPTDRPWRFDSRPGASAASMSHDCGDCTCLPWIVVVTPARTGSARCARSQRERDAPPRPRAGGTFAQQADSLAAPLDILVGTPGKVAQHAGRGNLFYGDVQLVRRAHAGARVLRPGSTQLVKSWWHPFICGCSSAVLCSKGPSAAPCGRAQASAARLPGVAGSRRSSRSARVLAQIPLHHSCCACAGT